MINRVLIRIKAVQVLYSYLLTENHFMIEGQPLPPTKEKRFAYSLYLDMLIFMRKLAQEITFKGQKPLSRTKFINVLGNDDTLRAFANKYGNYDFPLEKNIKEIASKIKDSAIFKDFISSEGNDNSSSATWEKIFNHIIIRDPGLNKTFTELPDYSAGGVERMISLMEETFRNLFKVSDNLNVPLTELKRSLDKARELYFRLLLLISDITRLRESQIEEAKKKYLKSSEDINPNYRFVDNSIFKSIYNDSDIEKYNSEAHIAWLSEDPLLVHNLLKEIMASEDYLAYMNLPSPSRHDDAELWRNIFKHIIFQNEGFLEYMETKSVFWNDDLEIVGTFLLKTLRRYEESLETEGIVFPMYPNEDSGVFGKKLITFVINEKDYYKSLIDEFVREDKWDTERIPFMDVVITMMALAEILNFPEIPVSVTYNEYVELAKSYSTNKSGAFVNGILRSIVEKLRKEGVILK